MSLSHQKGILKSTEERLPEVLPCPECGVEAMKRMKGPCTLLDGTFIAELERWRCVSCGEDFFDLAAMDQIALQRSTQKSNTKKNLIRQPA